MGDRYGHVNYHTPYVGRGDDAVAGRWVFRLDPGASGFVDSWKAAVADFQQDLEMIAACNEAGYNFNYGDMIEHGKEVLARHGLHLVEDDGEGDVLVDHDEPLILAGRLTDSLG